MTNLEKEIDKVRGRWLEAKKQGDLVGQKLWLNTGLALKRISEESQPIEQQAEIIFGAKLK